MWEELDQLGRQVSAAKTPVARKVADSLVWQREGFASPAEYLAAHGGTSLGAAKRDLDTSKALPGLPTARGALLEGSLSADQGALIAEAARVNPAAERAFDALVTLAERSSRLADGDDGGRKRRYLGLIRCDLTALRRGSVEGDELCEIAGVGPVPVATALDMLGDATWKLLITQGIDVCNVTAKPPRAAATPPPPDGVRRNGRSHAKLPPATSQRRWSWRT